MRNTFDIAFYARASKANKKGLSHIEMSVTTNGDRHFYNTPMMVRPEEFNRKRQPKEIRDYCELMRSRVNEILTDMLAHQEPVTSDKILSYLRQGGYKSHTSRSVCDEYLNILKGRVDNDLTLASYRKYEHAADLFCNIVGADKEFTAITNADILKFRSFCIGKYQKSSVASIMTKVKTIYKFGCGNGYNKCGIDAFNGIKIEKELKKVETITIEDLHKIMTKDFHCERLKKVADLFVFSCGSGLAFCDTQGLQADDFVMKDGNWCVFKARKKTGNTFYSVLMPYAAEIALKYDFNLPKMSNQRLNSYLKEIQDLCGITSVPSLHFHIARHFYAMNLLNNGVPVTTLQKCLGHSSITMSMHYAHAVESTIVREVTQAFA